MTHVMRMYSALAAAALGLTVAAVPSLAQEARRCVVQGTPSSWGIDSTGAIAIAAGGSCLFSLRTGGEVLNSRIAQKPAHGTLRQLNVSSFVYKSEAGYRGQDTFSVQATGKSRLGSGSSLITINATLR